MGLFIEVQVTAEAARDPDVVRKLSDVCPVNIFAADPQGELEIVEKNVDECTLCELCLGATSPGTVRVLKLYDDGRALERRA